MNKTTTTSLVIPINGAKCQAIDDMLTEFYDKLDIHYPEYRNSN